MGSAATVGRLSPLTTHPLALPALYTPYAGTHFIPSTPMCTPPPPPSWQVGHGSHQPALLPAGQCRPTVRSPLPSHPLHTSPDWLLLILLLAAAAAAAADWTTRPLGILLALEDASLRGVPLDSLVIERNAIEGAEAGRGCTVV